MVNFIIKSNDNFIVNYNLNLINQEYNKNGKKGINNYIQNNILECYFISNNDKKQICSYLYHNLSIVKFLKIIIKYFRKPINKKTLCLEDIDNITKNYIDIKDNNMYYRFTLLEINNLINAAIFNHNLGYPEPLFPRNPYTRKVFTSEQLLYIYHSSIANNIKVCKALEILNECDYSIDKLVCMYSSYLCHTSCNNYIYDDDCKNILIDLFNDFPSLEEETCVKCILNLKNYKEIFLKALLTYQKESNNLFTLKSTYSLVLNAITQYNLTVPNKHYMYHRKYKTKNIYKVDDNFGIENKIKINKWKKVKIYSENTGIYKSLSIFDNDNDNDLDNDFITNYNNNHDESDINEFTINVSDLNLIENYTFSNNTFSNNLENKLINDIFGLNNIDNNIDNNISKNNNN